MHVVILSFYMHARRVRNQSQYVTAGVQMYTIVRPCVPHVLADYTRRVQSSRGHVAAGVRCACDSICFYRCHHWLETRGVCGVTDWHGENDTHAIAILECPHGIDHLPASHASCSQWPPAGWVACVPRLPLACHPSLTGSCARLPT